MMWIAHFSHKTPIVDSDGFETGEHEFVYSTPEKLLANVSPAKGESMAELFGESEDYDKVIVVSGKSPVTETSVLWIDNATETSPAYPHDYIVKKVAESINSTSLAVKKVNVS